MQGNVRQVRFVEGVPLAAAFAAHDGSPIIIDSESGLAYWLDSSGVAQHLIGWGVVSAVGDVSTSTALTDAYYTARVLVSGLTLSLPSASAARIGYTWTVVLAVAGDVTVAPQGTDTLLLPTTDTSITFYDRGSSLSFRCLTATSWGIV